ncbi:glycosyltransferase [Bradyrhizobium septentrionale]|uniref:Glycosyltransferase n=1 Tax=Bradyrhizobium septentrionale TaxID=1404411 RepID=A0ABZ2NRY7_9BRAD
MTGETFRDLFDAHEGKVSDKWDHYLSVYENTFGRLRQKPVSLLEIGVQNGGSLEIWAAYFRHAQMILGVDIDPSCGLLRFEDQRISVVVGDAKTIETGDAIRALASSFDVIIDDGSHVSSDIIANFLRLVPLLADDGIYLIEDMHASYWKELGGELFAPYSAAAFFKTLTDVLNYEHWSLDKAPADLLQPFANHAQVPLPMEHLERIESVAFLNSVCIISKTGGNRTRLGDRRVSGKDGAVTEVERFPSEAFARKSELASAEDYFWAWQAQPPMEALAAKTQALEVTNQALAAMDQALAATNQALEAKTQAHATMTQALAATNQALEAKTQVHATTTQALVAKTQALAATTQAVAGLEQQAADHARRMDELREQNAALNHVVEETKDLKRELLASREEAHQLREHLSHVHRSLSWRLTSPLRSVKRLVQFGWHFRQVLFSHRLFLLASGRRLAVKMLAEPDLAEAMMLRVHADPDFRARVLAMGKITPAQYATISAVARWTEAAYRGARRVLRRLRRSRLFSGATRAQPQIKEKGIYFHLDMPPGILVPARGVATFRGWAVDTNTREAAELRLFANGRLTRIDRYKRGDVTAAFADKISPNATSAFEAKIPLRQRLTRIRVELAREPDKWTSVYRALVLRIGPVEVLRDSRTYDPTEWLDVQREHLAAQSSEIQDHILAMVRRPAFVVVVDARESERDLGATVDSLRAQSYPAAQVVFLGGGGDDPSDGKMRSTLDCTGIGEHWIDRFDIHAAAFAQSDYLLFVEPGDRLIPSALYELASAVNFRPTSAMIYGDELFRTPSDEPLPFRKPDWSPDYLESFDYIGRSVAFSVGRARELSLELATIYDFTLRFTEGLQDERVLHIDNLLLEREREFARSADGAADEDIIAVQGRLERTGRRGTIVPAPLGTNCYHAHVQWDRVPEVSIVIPTAGYTKTVDGREIDLIVNITDQIARRSTFPIFEIVVVDNGDLNQVQKEHLAKLGCRCVTYEEPIFNVAKKLNLGASVARGELLLLMNDDMEIIQDDWIERLCDHLAKPEVAVVGCRLLYPDHTTQHVGVIHYQGNPDHVRRGYPADDAGYFNSTCGVRNYLAVTGACMLTRKAIFDQVGGYTERLAISYNDADFCLKVREAGYRVVYTGEVALIHMESLSRVPSAAPEEVRYYRERWTPDIPEDPFYNERFLTLAPPSFEPRTNDRLL